MKHHAIITHVIIDGGLPETGKRKQLSPICSNPEDIEKGFYFLGYNGYRRLKLADLEANSNIHAVPEQPLVKENRTIWIDAGKKVYDRTDGDLMSFENWTHIGTVID